MKIYNPNIPDEKVIDFNVSFWASISSGIITGIITGLIVGISVYFIQNMFEQRRNLINLEKEFSIFELKLNNKLSLYNSFTLSISGERNVPYNFLESVLLIQEQPVDYWIDEMEKSKRYAKVRNVHKALYKYNELFTVSIELDIKLQNRLLDDYDEYNFPRLLEPMFGLINEHDLETLKKFVGEYLTDERVDYLKSIQEEDAFKDLVADYKSKRQAFMAAMENLQNNDHSA